MAQTANIIHASCVALNGRAVLIIGASGSGKSGLALQLLAFGCDLIADDRTELRLTEQDLWVLAPQKLAGLIEARHMGLLKADFLDRARLQLVVDLDRTETTRLPEPKSIDLLGKSLPLLHKVETAHFPAAILQYLKAGRRV